MSKIAVIFPSRGLLFSRTAEDLLNNLKGYDYKIFFSHKRPIPDCFNEPLERALDDDSFTHVWFVEDDMKMPSDTLKTLLATKKAVVTADYPVNKNGRGSVFKVQRRAVFCGTGCLLVKREVFDEFKKPVFYTGRKWNIKNFGDYVKMTASNDNNLDGYGLHDINFCMDLYEKNIPIHTIRETLAQRKLVSLGKQGSNDGAHNIEIWDKIKPNELLNTVKSWPVMPSGNLVTVMTDDGEMNVSKDHAEKLIKAGKARKMPKRQLVVDWNRDEPTDSADNL